MQAPVKPQGPYPIIRVREGEHTAIGGRDDG